MYVLQPTLWNYAGGLHHIYTFAEATQHTLQQLHMNMQQLEAPLRTFFFLSALLLKHLLPMAGILLSSSVKKAGVLD